MAFAAAILLSSAVSAQTQITDEAGLKAIANGLSGDYVLAADITLTGQWTPLGTEASPFTGTFDGGGHSIKGLTVTASLVRRLTVTSTSASFSAMPNR